jgi:hypothetical protein
MPITEKLAEKQYIDGYHLLIHHFDTSASPPMLLKHTCLDYCPLKASLPYPMPISPRQSPIQPQFEEHHNPHPHPHPHPHHHRLSLSPVAPFAAPPALPMSYPVTQVLPYPPPLPAMAPPFQPPPTMPSPEYRLATTAAPPAAPRSQTATAHEAGRGSSAGGGGGGGGGGAALALNGLKLAGVPGSRKGRLEARLARDASAMAPATTAGAVAVGAPPSSASLMDPHPKAPCIVDGSNPLQGEAN